MHRKLNDVLIASAENVPKVYDSGHKVGFEEGKQAEYDAFWDGYQDNGNRVEYSHGFGGGGWNNTTLKPKYDIKPTNAYMMFRYCAYEGDLVELFDELGITLDFSNATNTAYMFALASGITHIGVVDVRNSTTNTLLDCAFQNNSSLVTIDKIYLKTGRTAQFNASTFNSCSNLENVTFEGEINSNGLNLQWSTKLSKASIENIINCLSSTTSGLTVTFSKTAVNNAFGIDIDDESTWTFEWLGLRGTKSKWTFNYV